MEGQGVVSHSSELDQASHLLTESTASNAESSRKSKHQAIHFASKGKVFQTGEIWSFCSGYDGLPLYYGRIQKISFTHELGQEAVCKLHMNRLKATSFPFGCGTFYARKVKEIISADDVSQQIVPQTSTDGKEYTILPKIGEFWVIDNTWNLRRWVLAAMTLLKFLMTPWTIGSYILLEQEYFCDEDDDEDMLFKAVKEYKYNEIEGSEPIFTIPKSERLRFSHMAPASRVTKEIRGVLKELVKVDPEAIKQRKPMIPFC